MLFCLARSERKGKGFACNRGNGLTRLHPSAGSSVSRTRHKIRQLWRREEKADYPPRLFIDVWINAAGFQEFNHLHMERDLGTSEWGWVRVERKKRVRAPSIECLVGLVLLSWDIINSIPSHPLSLSDMASACTLPFVIDNVAPAKVCHHFCAISALPYPA